MSRRRLWMNRGRMRPRRGAAAVEFVLTAPVLVMLLFGTIELGHYFAQLIAINGIAQDATRYGARASTQAQAVIQAELAATQLIRDLNLSCAGGGGCVVDAQMETRSGINYVVLTVDVPFDSVTGAAPGENSGGVQLPLRWRASAAYPHVGASILAAGP